MIKNNKELSKIKRELWKKAYKKLIAWYRDLDPSVFSRFLQEKAALRERNDIIYFDIIGRIRERAKALGYYTETIRSDGASLIAYLLGAVDDNPLKPFYYCKEHGWIRFSSSKEFYLDLNDKRLCTWCSLDNAPHRFETNGTNIPFEAYLWRGKEPHHRINVPTAFLEEGTQMLKNISDEYGVSLPITIEAESTLDLIHNLETKTGIKVTNISLHNEALLTAFCTENIEDILNIPNKKLYRNMLRLCKPKSFFDLLKITGMAHSVQVWTNNLENRLKNNLCDFDEIPVFAEDIFLAIRTEMERLGINGEGLANEIAYNAVSGYYAENQMEDEFADCLILLGFDNWFKKFISEIQYIISKSHAVIILKRQIYMLWYKLNYPDEYSLIMECAK